MTFCGSVGCELMEPLSFKGRKGSGIARWTRRLRGWPRFARPATTVDKYRYTFRLWGRMLHDPGTTADVWQRQLRQTYGAAAAPIELALAEASRILPLITTAHLPSAANNNYWPEMYTNMSIVEITPNREPYNDTPTPRRFGTVSPLDPQLFSTIEEHAASMLEGRPSARLSPVEVADRLFVGAFAAKVHLNDAVHAEPSNLAVRRAAVDISVQAGLGHFFAHKLRAGVLYSLFDRTQAGEFLDAAISAYQAARDEWHTIAALTRDVYARDVSYGPGAFQRGHWEDRLPAIEHDLSLMREQRSRAKPAQSTHAALVAAVLKAPPATEVWVSHTPPATFVRDGAIDLLVTATARDARPTSGTVPLPPHAPERGVDGR